MVVWEKLPLQLHLGVGQVTIASERSLSVELAEPHAEIPAGTEVLWDGGKLGTKSAESTWIRSWDEAAQTATLETALIETPEVGDAVILGPGVILANGRMLYAEHCQHCHGVTGDGQGPTAPYLNPKPRDYRQGLFKFTTTQGSKRAKREDLQRVIENGVPGTYMPSFKLLTNDEMTSITEYVLWLSMRGELEYQLVRLLNDSYAVAAIKDRTQDGEISSKEIQQEFATEVNDPDGLPAEVLSMVDRLVQDWETSQEVPAEVQPLTARVPYTVESIAKGRGLYLKESLKCAQCHGAAGYGNGSQTFAVSKDENGAENKTPGLYDTWGNRIQPRNLHTGIYRGGRRPIDLYSRIYAGIKGTPMPAFSTAMLRKSNPDDVNSELTDEDIWHLVNYIYSVPFEKVEAGDGHAPVDPASQSSQGSSAEVAAQ